MNAANPRLNMTPDARQALKDAGFSRRNFLKTSGALIVGFSAFGLRQAEAQRLENVSPLSPRLDRVDSWIAIDAVGKITVYTGKCELGQGITTAQAQLAAEELDVPFNKINLVFSDTDFTPDQGVTSGSQSHPANFRDENLGGAAAAAREHLFKVASERLSVSADKLTAWDGVIRVKGDESKKVTYAELLRGNKFNISVGEAKRKPAREWKVLGTSVPRMDFPQMMTGRIEYVHNVKLPGMLHGRPVRPPVVGAQLMSVDESSVAGMPGLVKIVTKKNFVGVVAEKQYQAIQIASKLKVNWSAGPGLPDQTTFYEHLRTLPSRDELAVDSKDTAQKLATGTLVKATYLYPYQSHGSLASSCAVADVQGEKATIYSATQGIWPIRHTTAMVLGLKPENVHAIFRRGSGCYGINGVDTVSYDAALLSQAVGKPVRVQLTRKDEMAWENYGFQMTLDQRASLDAQGNIIAWEHESWSPGLGGRPQLNRPGNVITGMLLGFEPAVPSPGPARDPERYNNNLNVVPSYVAGRVNGKAQGTGTVASEKVHVHNVASIFPTGPLRSPSRIQNSFAHESFMDELAFAAKADPVEFRLRHLRSERVIDVLKGATKAAKWDTRPSPKPGNKRTGIAIGRGVACVAYEGDNGYTSIVVDVAVDQDTGKVEVKKMWCAIDAGPISNPDGLKNQAEGGALQGMSRALGEEITWDHEKVTSVDWRTYHSLPLGFAIPQLECVLVNRPDEEATGAGETTITIMAAAIANAIFDATGVRLRQVPFTAQRVKAALMARA